MVLRGGECLKCRNVQVGSGALYCFHRFSRFSENSYMSGGGSLRHEPHLIDVRSLIPRPRQDVGPIAGEARLDVEGGRRVSREHCNGVLLRAVTAVQQVGPLTDAHQEAVLCISTGSCQSLSTSVSHCHSHCHIHSHCHSQSLRHWTPS
jgi:hypothetical protein